MRAIHWHFLAGFWTRITEGLHLCQSAICFLTLPAYLHVCIGSVVARNRNRAIPPQSESENGTNLQLAQGNLLGRFRGPAFQR